MRVKIICLITTLLVTSCWSDEPLYDFPPELALSGEWDIAQGVFLWDGNTRVSTINPMYQSTPSVSMQFVDGNQYLVRYQFIVTDNQDSITFANGLQQGQFQIAVEENRILHFEGLITFTENVTNTTDQSEISYSIGNEVDTLWIEDMALNNLLDGSVTGVFLRNNR
jgi:hypothetical protein